MKSIFRDIRLLPVVLAAAGSLLVLKVAGLAIDGGYVLQFNAPSPPARAEFTSTEAARRLWTVDRGAAGNDITGSTAAAPAEPPADKGGASVVKPEALKVSDKMPPDVAAPAVKAVPPAERAVLERLQERREELDARAREIEIRENLLKEAEKRAQTRSEEAKQSELTPEAAAEKREEAEKVRLKNLVIMYENMKAKDAARIFDRLEIRLLVDVASQINPRRMSDILAQMSSEAAERLTVELAAKPGQAQKASAPSTTELPKIEGRPAKL